MIALGRTRLTVLAAMTSGLLLSLSGAAVADTEVNADLAPQNGSGAGGTVSLTATDDGRLKVVIRATGLVPKQPHAQHIHGAPGGGHFMCPTMANDTNGDGVLTNEEAVGEYGAVFFALTTKGDASAESGLAIDRMPVADASGNINYRRTFAAKDVPDRLLDRLSEMHVVQHGIDVNGNGRYDLKALGESTFAKGLGMPGVPEEATNPATCGVVTGAGAGTAPHGGVETGGGQSGAANLALGALLGCMLLGISAAALARLRPAASAK
jgi:hypothetical protein